MTQIVRTAKDVGHAIRTARKARGLTQAELAELAGVWQRTVSTIETGGKGAKLETVFALLAALDLEIEIVPRSQISRDDLESIF